MVFFFPPAHAGIDRIVTIPDDLQATFEQTIESIEEEAKMRYVTSLERKAKKRDIQAGIIQTQLEAVADMLEIRIGQVDQAIVERINQICGPTLLNHSMKGPSPLFLQKSLYRS